MRNSARRSLRGLPATAMPDYNSLKILILLYCLHSAHSQPQQGVYDFFKKFQETLLGTHPSSSETPSPPVSSKSSRPGKLQRPEGTVEMTQRRALLEYSLNSHYGKFIGGNQHLNAIQTLPIKEHSWTDKSTNCVLYNEGIEAYWMYYWCPQDYVKQVNLTPKTMNKDGSVKEFAAQRVVHLGTYKTRSQMTTHSMEEEPYLIESYDGGDECEIFDSGGLRSKKKRKTRVVFENSCQIGQGEEYRILSVLESKPCQYTILVCSSKQETTSVPQRPGVVDDMNERSPIKQHVQDALLAYTKQSGLNTAQMSLHDRTSSLHVGLPPFPPSRKEANVKLIREMFIHAYDSYMYNAYPASELKPISCTPGTFDLVRLPALTLIDTLDTLLIMENYTEFARATERLRDLDDSTRNGVDNQGNSIKIQGGLFSQNQNVSVFETNIRVLGGLLSAHQMAVAFMDNKVLEDNVRDEDGNVRFGLPKDTGAEYCSPDQIIIDDTLDDVQAGNVNCLDGHDCNNRTATTTWACVSYWEYDGLLLDLAHDIGKRLLPAFKTSTGIPYGTVNLLNGIPRGETPIASLAGGGTLNLEFELLSRLTGDESFGKAAKLASRALWVRRSNLNLLGKHLDVEKGEWTETLSGIGSNSDSFYEYMIKHYIMFPEDSDFWPMFVATYNGVLNETRLGEWYGDVDMTSGMKSGSSRRTFESLMAFYPGMQVLAGELSPAAKTLNSFFMVRETTGLLPERFNFAQWKVEGGGAGLHPLRPELLESCYFLHKSTEGTTAKRTSPHSSGDENDAGTSGWLWAADYSLDAINRLAWTQCGFATIKEVNPSTTGAIPELNKQFTPKIRTLNEMPSFFLSETLKYLYLAFDDNNILHNDDDREWVFTTEAHPIHHESKKKHSIKMGGNGESGAREELTMLLKKRSLVQTSRSKRRKNLVGTVRKGISSQDEKWSIRTPSSLYMSDVAETEAGFPVQRPSVYGGPMVHNFASHIHTTGLIGSFVTTDRIMKEELGDHIHGENNMAALSLNGLGLETSILKGCPNIQSTSLLWMNALNGGVLDYGDVYISSLSDDAIVDKRFAVGSLGASAALAFHGSGLFLSMAEHNDSALCPVTDNEIAPLRSAPKKEIMNVPDGTRRYDMGGEVGSFDVFVFENGNGFFIHHVNTGETVTTTIISNEYESAPCLLVYSSTPSRQSKTVTVHSDEETTVSWKFASGNWKAIFNRKDGESVNQASESNEHAKVRLPSRRVVVAANPGRSFACEVLLVQRFVISKTDFINVHDNDQSAIEYEKVLSTFPCAPGLFGPTKVSELIANNGVIVEGTLHLPLDSENLGCDVPAYPQSFQPEEGPIQLVYRGQCTFQSKAVNQFKGFQAKAVIVLNLNDELFLMSNGFGSDPYVDDEESQLPASVLLTRLDGNDLIAKMHQHGPVIAKVMVQPQRGGVKGDSTGNLVLEVDKAGKLDWPVVKTSAASIQIFASQGWGVHAVDLSQSSVEVIPDDADVTSPPRKDTNDPATRKWQLLLLQHSIKDVD